MPVQSFAEFILYIIPGFLSFQLYRSFYPVKERSDVIQITWSVVYGILIFAIVRWIDINILNATLRSTTSGFPSFRFIVALFISAIIFGLLLTLFQSTRTNLASKYPALARLAPDPQCVWAKVAPTGQWAVVFLDDNSIYMGWISEYTFNPNNTDQDFLLKDAKRVNEQLQEQYLVTGIGVYLNIRDVKRIEFLKSR